MKKFFSLIALAVVGCAMAHDGGRGNAALDLAGGKVSVDYGRPALKGRDIEALIRPGQEWRMGADAATTLSTDVALKFGDKTIQPGKYILKAKLVAPQEWVLIVQSEDKTSSMETPLKYQKVESSAEMLAIKLEKSATGGRFVLQWGSFTLSTEFQKA
ncbi:MAG: DUF2911 domain-containing protein [Acidobacteriota bacterium]